MKELKFRAVIPERNSTIYFTFGSLLSTIICGKPLFSIRTILIPWLRAGNVPDVYTGRKDKHNIDIYEGDKVLFDGKYERVIHYDRVLARFSTIQEDDEDGEYFGLGHTRREVIGNIHERNPIVKYGRSKDDTHRGCQERTAI